MVNEERVSGKPGLCVMLSCRSDLQECAGRLYWDALKLKFVNIMVLSCSHSGESCGRSGGLRYTEQRLCIWMQNLQWKTVLP
jgi:hypothetical protein